MLNDNKKRGEFWQKLAHESADVVSDALNRIHAPHGRESLVKELADIWHAFRSTREEHVVPLILAGREAEAAKIVKSVQAERISSAVRLCEALAV